MYLITRHATAFLAIVLFTSCSSDQVSDLNGDSGSSYAQDSLNELFEEYRLSKATVPIKNFHAYYKLGSGKNSPIFLPRILFQRDVPQCDVEWVWYEPSGFFFWSELGRKSGIGIDLEKMPEKERAYFKSQMEVDGIRSPVCDKPKVEKVFSGDELNELYVNSSWLPRFNFTEQPSQIKLVKNTSKSKVKPMFLVGDFVKSPVLLPAKIAECFQKQYDIILSASPRAGSFLNVQMVVEPFKGLSEELKSAANHLPSFKKVIPKGAFDVSGDVVTIVYDRTCKILAREVFEKN